MSLLKQINDGVLDEGLMDKLKGAYAGFKGAAPAAGTDHDKPEEAISADVAGDDYLADFSRKIQEADTSAVRTIIFCNATFFTSSYVASKNGEKIVMGALADDADFTQFLNDVSAHVGNPSAAGAASGDIVAGKDMFYYRIMNKEKFTLKEEFGNAKMPFGIVLDIPSNQFKKLSSATNIGDQRKAVGHLLSHHFYVFTVNTAKALALPGSTGVIEYVDPYILLNHPNRSLLDAMQSQWNRSESPAAKKQIKANKSDGATKQRRQKEIDSLDHEKQKTDKQLDVVKSASNLAGASSFVQKEVLALLATHTKDDKAAEEIKKYLNRVGRAGKNKTKFKQEAIDQATSVGRNGVVAILNTP